jgi:hypothetical protein
MSLKTEELINFGLTIFGVIFGFLLLLYSYTSKIPSEYALTELSGKLLGVEKQVGSKGSSIVVMEIDGFTSKLGYSGPAKCGDVYEKLLPLKYKNINIKYNPQDLVTPLISESYFRVYDLKQDNLEICSYFDIYEGNEQNKKLGYLFGTIVILSCLSPLGKKIFKQNS